MTRLRARPLSRVLSALPLLLLACAAYADIPGTNPPADESNVVGLVLFAILFFGSCAGFAWFIWRNEKKKPK